MPYINYNGNIHSEHEQLLTPLNRGVQYGDGFFETMAMFNSEIPFLEYHWQRIEFTMSVLSAELPRRFDRERFISMVQDLMSVNNYNRNARVRLQFFRKGGGRYLPLDNELAYIISIEPLQNDSYETGEGLKVSSSDEHFKAISTFGDLKSSSALGYVLAAQYMHREGWDELILMNHFNQVCESVYSNILLVNDNKLITPDLDSGCVSGVMRSVLIDNLTEDIDERTVEAQELLQADEIILMNAVRGVQWVKTYKSKTYGNKKAVEITAFLNELIKKKE